ncbi:MAG: minor capsid protein [Candidatus Saccharibacteria bacterium]|nr:minor capsid protein [Candidatus Saccharibacteria bacterium]
MASTPLRKRTDAYWARRANDRLASSEKITKQYITKVQDVYRKARRKTINEVKAIYEAYYRSDNTFDMQALRAITPAGDVKRFLKRMEELGLNTYLPDNYKGRMSRLEFLNAQMWAGIKEAALKQTQLETEAHSKVYENDYYHSGYDVSRGIGSTPTSFSMLDKQTVDKVLDSKFQGKNYSERIWANTDILAQSLQNKLASAIASGQSVQKTAREFRERFDVNQYYAERLIRTESNYFHNQAEIDSYKEMGFKYYRFLATLDNRTSEICQENDGNKIKVEDAIPGENMPPLHPNCRSTIVPYFKEYEPETRMYRDPETGRNHFTYNISFNDWRKQMDKSYELAVARQKAEASAKSRNRTKSLSKIMSESATRYINSKLKAMPDERKVFNNYKDKVMVSNTAYKGTAHFSPRSESIVFNLKRDSYGSIWSDKYRTMIHESGHNIDYLATKGKGYMSEIYKDGIFAKTLKKEAEKLFNSKQYSIDGIKLTTSQQITRAIKTNFPDKRDYSYISDIFSGVTKNKFNLGAYHKASYWNDRSLAHEAFTEMYSASILNKNATKLIRRYFPESYSIYRDIIKEIGGKK